MSQEMLWDDGNRFCPTDEQLVNRYLKQKILGNDHHVSQILELDVCSIEPWNLPEHLKITPNDLEWYFFSPRYLNAGRPKRISDVGYWKATGKPRKIMNQLTNEEIGTKRIFVFHKGRFPHGVNTKHVMHEYSAAIDPPAGQMTFVLSKIMKRPEEKAAVPTYDEGETSGTPKYVANGEVPKEDFKKADPDRYEFANEGSLRGQKHLSKTISRKKRAHVPVNQAPSVQSSSAAACVGVGKFGLEEEVERLKRDKNFLMQELVGLRQQQQATEHQLQTVGERVQVMELRQQQMMSFLAKEMQSLCFLNQLVQEQNENNRCIAGGTKKRKFAAEEEENSVGGGEKPSLNNSTPLLIGNTPSSSPLDGSTSSSRISGLTLSEDPAADGSLFLPVESGFPVNHVSTAISEVQCPPYLVTDLKNMHNTGQVTTVLNSAEMEGMLPESSFAICNISTVAYEPENAGYMDSPSPVLDVTITGETGVFLPDQNVDILADAISKLPSINDAFWEEFLAASPLTGDIDKIHPNSQESSIVKEWELISWEENGWNKVQQMNHLPEQMGLLASEGKSG